MAIFSFTGATIFADGLDVSGVSNSVDMMVEAAELDVTTFGSGGTKVRIAGNHDSKLSISGFMDISAATLIDATLFSDVAATSNVMVAPQGISAGNIAYVVSGIGGSYSILGKQGDVAPYALEYRGAARTVRSTVMATGTALTTTGTGSITQLGATSATQKVYCQLHVVSVSGTSTPTFTATVKSAALVGFGSPTTRATFTAATGVTSQRIVVDGAITDQFWRVDYTISGTTPSFSAVVTVGIA